MPAFSRVAGHLNERAHPYGWALSFISRGKLSLGAMLCLAVQHDTIVSVLPSVHTAPPRRSDTGSFVRIRSHRNQANELSDKAITRVKDMSLKNTKSLAFRNHMP